MFKINRMGVNSEHIDGINVNRPFGSGDYLFLCINTPTIINNDTITAEQLLENHKNGKRDKYGDSIFEIQSPCFVIYKKNSPQRYFSLETPYINDWIHFDSTDENIDLFIESLNLPFNRPIFIHNAKRVSSRIQTLFHELLRKGNHSDNIIDLGLKSLFYSLSDAYSEESEVSDKFNQYRSTFDKIRLNIYSYKENEKLTVNDYADKINLSVSYFQHIYKKLYGVSITHDIIRSRIEYACSLLLNEYSSINDIARRAGYENPEHFTRQFKELTGYTPKQYREKTYES